MEGLKNVFRIVAFELPKQNLVLSKRFYSKRIDHIKLSSNMTFIATNDQYKPNTKVLTAYNNSAQQVGKPPIDPSKKPIVLLYGWLLSQDKFLKKFTDFYNDHGFDVLRVKVKVSEVLWPKSVKGTVNKIENFLNAHLDRPYLVHGFSVGGFVHTELVKSLLTSDKTESKLMMNQIKGQIFDSVVDMYGVADGVSASLYLNNPIRRAITRMAIQGYIDFTYKNVYHVYEQASKIFHSNPLLVPSLMLYSNADTIGAAGPIEKAIESWRSKGVPVAQKCWEDSEHVGHYKADPDEYKGQLNSFLTSLGFICDKGLNDLHEVNKDPCDGGLKDSDVNTPNRFKTDIKKTGDKPIEVMFEVAEDEMKKTHKITAANKQH